MPKSPKEHFSETAKEFPFDDDDEAPNESNPPHNDPLFLPEEDHDMEEDNMHDTSLDNDVDLTQVQQMLEGGDEGKSNKLR